MIIIMNYLYRGLITRTQTRGLIIRDIMPNAEFKNISESLQKFENTTWTKILETRPTFELDMINAN